jgi:uncharacterized protein
MPTPAFQRYIAPARRHPQLWRLGLGIGVILVCQLLWVGAITLALSAISVPAPDLRAGGEIGTTPVTMIVLLLSFAGMGFGAVLAARLLHRRGAGTLVGHGPAALRHFTYGAALILVLHGGAFLLVMGGIDLEPGLTPGVWLAVLPLALFALLIQTGAEEVVFRGYLQQQLAARFGSALVWMLLPSIAFGLLHYEPGQMGENVWPVVGVTALFGLDCGRPDSAVGHPGAGLGAAFRQQHLRPAGRQPAGDLSGLALFQTPFGADDVETMPMLLVRGCGHVGGHLGLCRFALRRG